MQAGSIISHHDFTFSRLVRSTYSILGLLPNLGSLHICCGFLSLYICIHMFSGSQKWRADVIRLLRERLFVCTADSMLRVLHWWIKCSFVKCDEDGSTMESLPSLFE